MKSHEFRSMVTYRSPNSGPNWREFPYMYYASNGVVYVRQLLEDEPTPEKLKALDEMARHTIGSQSDGEVND